MVSMSVYCDNCGAANQAEATLCFACNQPLQPTVGEQDSISIGPLVNFQLLMQRYRILGQLGRGGFGAVYQAEDIRFGNRAVAIKEMNPVNLSPQEIAEATEAFKHEAFLLANLTHPNLPRIYDHFSDSGRWYLVMDFIEGETLEEYLQKRRVDTLPWRKRSMPACNCAPCLAICMHASRLLSSAILNLPTLCGLPRGTII